MEPDAIADFVLRAWLYITIFLIWGEARSAAERRARADKLA